jgi:hypothetical protein
LALVCGLVTAVAIPCLPAGLPILLAAAVGAVWGGWRSRAHAVPATPEAALACASEDGGEAS